MFGSGLYGTTLYGTAGSSDDGTQTLTDYLIFDAAMLSYRAAAFYEAILLSETVNADTPFSAIVEHLTLSHNVVPVGIYAFQAIEQLKLSARLQYIAQAAINETPAFNAALISDLVRLTAIAETLRLSDPLRANQTLSVPELLALHDVIRSVLRGDIADAVDFNDAVTNTTSHYAALISTMALTDNMVGAATFTLLVNDDMEFADALSSHARFFATVMDTAAFTVALTIDNAPYLGIAMNAANKSVTEYRPYAFNSLAKLRNRLYGAMGDGLYRLEGPDDAGVDIEAYARTALSRIAGGKKAHVDSAYLGYSADGQMQLKVITTEATGTKTGRVYELKAQTADTNRAGRIKLGKGVQSVYWAFELGNVLGSDFTIDVIELRVLALSRRI